MATTFYVEHLKERELKQLTEYKHRGEDRSITYKYVLSPLYSKLILLLPLWIAPNTVTFIGFLFACSGHAILMYYSPDLESQAPSWVYLYGGIALFLYMVLDNLDGKQARRTHSSSPLGHLFDHGCDALNVTLSGMSLLATVQLGADWMSMTLLITLGHAMLFAATLEEYFTGAMILRELNGPNEGLLTLCSIQIITGIVGASLWTTKVTIPFTSGLTVNLNQILYHIAAFPTLSAIVANTFGVLRYLRDAGLGPGQAVSTLSKHAAPMITFLLCFSGWVFLAPLNFAQQVLYIMWLSGIIIFDLVSRMILATFAGARYPFMPRLFYPVLACSLNAIVWEQFGIAAVDPQRMTILTFTFASLYCSWRIWCHVAQLCDFLNVRCFSLRKLREEPDNTKR